MSRREDGPQRGNQTESAMGVHGKDRKELRRLARYAAMGRVGNSVPGQGFLPESPIVPTQGPGAQNEGQSNI